MTLNLAASARLRYAAGALMYFAQGIPAGLLNIAMPAWLASHGVGAGPIASYLAVVALPWAFKLLSGPLMDRYEFLPMGRRRPWVLGAQFGLVLSFFGLMLVDRPDEQIGLLMAIGALINAFAATQDVAVDGMSIDLTPVEEQGRLNASMIFGKAIGWAISAGVSGAMLVAFGLATTAVIGAAVLAVIWLCFAMVLEREGERRLPWSSGEARSEPRPGHSFSSLFRGLKSVLWSRASLILMTIMAFDGVISGYGHALMPIAAVQLFGFTTPQWSQLVAAMGLVGAAAALGLGPFIDRYGPKRMFFLTTSLVAVHAFLLAGTQFLWQDTLYVKSMLAAWVMLGPVTMVCVIALAMGICATANSATQFAVYMSVGNLGASAGAKLYGLASASTSYVQAYVLLGALTIVLLLVLASFRHQRASNGKRKTAARYTIGLMHGEPGVFWSGAMRCPKCRSDMEQVMVAQTEIDRCPTCAGLWFDRGELDRVRTRQAAALLDIGDPTVGRAHNAIDRYRCPRCNGVMIRLVDPVQTHIWYEQCGSCHGSFFDAGELTDLATLSVSDFFKRFTAPERS